MAGIPGIKHYNCDKGQHQNQSMLFLGVSILSLDNSSDIDYLNHPRTPLDKRDYARFGLRAAFIPSLTNVQSFDRRMVNLEAFAVKVEAAIFASTNSQKKYLDEVAKKISEITKYIQTQGTELISLNFLRLIDSLPTGVKSINKKVEVEVSKLIEECRQISLLPLLIPNLDDPEEKKFVQRQLVMMLHAQNCNDCSLPYCSKVKEVLYHTKDCKLNKCPETHCYSSRQIMCHWENCLQPDCSFCGPLRPKPNKNLKN